MKIAHTQQIIKQAIICLNNVPPQNIQKAIILVCKEDNEHMNLKSLVGSQFSQSSVTPFGKSLSDGSTLIDPGQYIAFPNEDMNFIVRCYLAQYMKNAKFIFPISLSQISSISLMSIQQLLINFFSLFRDLDDLQMAKLAQSCGILALDIINQEQRNLYKERLLRPNGLLQQGFIIKYKRNAQIFINTIASKNLIFGRNTEGNILDQFQIFLKKVSYFQYKDHIKSAFTNSYFRYCQQELHITSIWHQLISSLYGSIPQIINKQKVDKVDQFQLYFYKENITQNNHQYTNMSYKLKTKQLQLLVPSKNHSQNSYSFLGKYQPKEITKPLPILPIIYSQLILIQLDLQISEQQVTDKIPGESKLMAYFLFLYQIGYISIDIYVFLASYFHIYHYLSTKTNDHKKDLISKISLLDIKKEKDLYTIRCCLKILLNELQNNELSLQNCKEIAIFLNKIINYCSKYREKLAITSKIFSSLQQHLANIYYKMLKSQRNKKNYFISAINLIKFLSNCKEHHQNQKIDILKQIVQRLIAHQHSYKLGYQIACILPLYEVQYILLAFYEAKIGLCPQNFKFIEEEKKHQILKLYYSDYANFLLKIGYHQRLRQLCISGLQATRNIGDQQIFRRFLVKASKQTEHQQFINCSILKQKQIVLNANKINQIQMELTYLRLI